MLYKTAFLAPLFLKKNAHYFGGKNLKTKPNKYKQKDAAHSYISNKKSNLVVTDKKLLKYKHVFSIVDNSSTHLVTSLYLTARNCFAASVSG